MKTVLEILRLALEALKLIKPAKEHADKIEVGKPFDPPTTPAQKPGKGPFDA